jgi:PhnB protein
MKLSGAYLLFNGNCREAMTFYSKIFGTKIDAIMTWGSPSPCGEGMVPEEEVKAYQDGISEEDKDRIMHMSFMLDNGTCIMASDTHPIMHKNPLVNGNNYQIALEPDTKEEADRLFEALSEGGSDAMPLQDMWWGSYHGSCTDKFAVRWMFDMSTFSSDEAKMKQNLIVFRPRSPSRRPPKGGAYYAPLFISCV